MIKLIDFPGVEITSYTYEVVGTYDDLINKKFQPTIILINNDGQKYPLTLPYFPYVKGTWTDEDVEKAITKYLFEIDK